MYVPTQFHSSAFFHNLGIANDKSVSVLMVVYHSN